eukprot:TRINITY_DN41078_c0_g1_i1.p1 TRINITY_DN41078_c0_g1~~TRINITY_DN41078_c0_g1_i1.p1  ORF type:complete len:121 (-),score=25.90 TRINITY_DN41078_c0_g1_i1:48-410(-)
MSTKEELRSRSVKELKDMLRAEGYDPAQIVGVEKDELVDKLLVLRRNPLLEDPFPLPLYSNCWPQFILRALLWALMQWFLLSFFLARHWNFLCLLLVTAALALRNVLVRSDKAQKRRKRL